MAILPVESVLGQIADRLIEDPAAGQEMARLAIGDLLMADMVANSPAIDALFQHEVVGKAATARRALCKSFISKRLEGADVTEVLTTAAHLSVLDAWATEICKWSPDNPFKESEVKRDAQGRFSREAQSHGAMSPEQYMMRPQSGTGGIAVREVNGRQEAEIRHEKGRGVWDTARAGSQRDEAKAHLGRAAGIEDARQDLADTFESAADDAKVVYTFRDPARPDKTYELQGQLRGAVPGFQPGHEPIAVRLASNAGLSGQDLEDFKLANSRDVTPENVFQGKDSHQVAQRAAFNVARAASGGNLAVAYEAGKAVPPVTAFREGGNLDLALNAEPGSARFYNRAQVAGGALTTLGAAAPGSGLTTLGLVASTIGAYGPEAEKVMGSSVRRTAYRYRGTEKKPDKELQQDASMFSASPARPLPAGRRAGAPMPPQSVDPARLKAIEHQAAKEVMDATGKLDMKAVNARAKQLLAVEQQRNVPKTSPKVDLDAFLGNEPTGFSSQGPGGRTRGKGYRDAVKNEAVRGDHRSAILSAYEGTSMSTPMLRQNVVGDLSAAHLMSKMPSAREVSLAIASGQHVPSQGVLIDADGDVVTEAVGYQGDHYLPFNLSNLRHLNGGSYVRTRAQGGPTTEDIYAGLMSNSRQFKVVSGSGVYTVEFDESFRGGRRFNDKAGRMVKDYARILDRLKEGKQYIQEGLDAEELRGIKEKAWELSGGNDSEYAAQFENLKAKAIKRKQLNQPSMEEATSIAAQEMPPQKGMTREQHYAAVQDRARQIYEQAREEGPKPLVLNGEGYKTALDTLKAQHPYYIKDIRYEPLHAFVANRNLNQDSMGGRYVQAAAALSQEEKKDIGYTKPGHIRPAKEKSGFYQSGYRNQTPVAQTDEYMRSRLGEKAAPATPEEGEGGGGGGDLGAGTGTTAGRVGTATQLVGPGMGSMFGVLQSAKMGGNVPGFGTNAHDADVDLTKPQSVNNYLLNPNYMMSTMYKMGAFNDFPGFIQKEIVDHPQGENRAPAMARNMRAAATALKGMSGPEVDQLNIAIQNATGMGGSAADQLTQAANAIELSRLGNNGTAAKANMPAVTSLGAASPLMIPGISDIKDKQQLRNLIANDGDLQNINPKGFNRGEVQAARGRAARYAEEIESGRTTGHELYQARANVINQRVNIANAMNQWAQESLRNPQAQPPDWLYNAAVATSSPFVDRNSMDELTFKNSGAGMAKIISRQLMDPAQRLSGVNPGVKELVEQQLALSLLHQRANYATSTGRIGWNGAETPGGRMGGTGGSDFGFAGGRTPAPDTGGGPGPAAATASYPPARDALEDLYNRPALEGRITPRI